MDIVIGEFGMSSVTNRLHRMAFYILLFFSFFDGITTVSMRAASTIVLDLWSIQGSKYMDIMDGPPYNECHSNEDVL